MHGFPLVAGLRSTSSAAARAALFAGFLDLRRSSPDGSLPFLCGPGGDPPGDPKISQVPDIPASVLRRAEPALLAMSAAGVAFDPAKNLGTLNPLPFALIPVRTPRQLRRRSRSSFSPDRRSRFAAEADGPAGSQRHFDGADPAGLRRPRRSGAEVTRFGPCHSGGGEARGLATRRRTLPLRRSAYRTALYLTASAADRPCPALRARGRLRSG